MFMLYVILILSIDVMNVENILVDVVPRARFFLFLFDAKFTFVSGLFPLIRSSPAHFTTFGVLLPCRRESASLERLKTFLEWVSLAFGENLLPL